MAELCRDSQGNENPVVNGRQQFALPNQEQIRDGGGVGDSPHRPESLRKVSMSLSRSSSV